MILALILTLTVMSVVTVNVCAADETPAEDTQVVESEAEDKEDNATSSKAISAALIVGIVGSAGAIGMAWAIAKSAEGMARQPEAASKINGAMMLGLVFIETAIIYALIVAILIIFVL